MVFAQYFFLFIICFIICFLSSLRIALFVCSRSVRRSIEIGEPALDVVSLLAGSILLIDEALALDR